MPTNYFTPIPEGQPTLGVGSVLPLSGAFGGVQPPQAPRAIAADVLEAFFAGAQETGTVLALRRKLPSIELPPNAPAEMRIARALGALVADLPLSLVSGAAGAFAGGLPGAGAAAVGVPMALREALMEAYRRGGVNSAEDLENVLAKGGGGLAAGAFLGALTAGAGQFARRMLPAFSPAARETAATTLEIGTAVAGASIFSQQAPRLQDFFDAGVITALVLGGVKGASLVPRTVSRLRAIYAETGVPPGQVAKEVLEKKSAEWKQTLIEDLPDDLVPASLGKLAEASRAEAALNLTKLDELRASMMKALAGEEIEAPPIRYEYITDPGVATTVARLIGEAFKPEIESVRRGVLHDADALRTAAEIIAGKGIPVTVVASPEETLARAFLFRGALGKALELARSQVGRADDEISTAEKLRLLGALEQVKMFYELVSGGGAEAARALRLHRQLKHDPAFRAVADKLIDRINLALKAPNAEGPGFAALVEAVAQLDEPARLAEFARKVDTATTWEKFIYLFRASAISGILTFGANLFGNQARQIIEAFLVRPIEAGLEALRMAGQGQQVRAAEIRAIMVQDIMGLRFGLMEGLKGAAERMLKFGDIEGKPLSEVPVKGPIGRAAKFFYDALYLLDVPYRIPAERSALYRAAVREALDRGLEPGGEAFGKFVREAVLDPKGKLAKADIEAAAQEGLQAVYQEKLKAMAPFQHAIAGTPAEFVFLFVRTPVNLLDYAVSLSGPFALVSPTVRAELASGGPAASRALARMIVGTGLMWLAFELHKAGILFGPGATLFDERRAAARAATGAIPNSIKIGERYYDISRFEPISRVLTTAAGLAELVEGLGKNPRASALAYGTLLFANATISTTYMSGLANAMMAALEPQRYGEAYLRLIASGFVPRVAGHAARLLDPMERETETVAEAVASQIPFLRQMLRPKLDVWGEPRRAEYLAGFLPVKVSEETKNEIKKEADRLMIVLSFPDRYTFVAGPLQPEQRRIDLTPEQVHRITERRGSVAMQIMAGMMATPEWQTAPDYLRAYVMKEVFARAGRLARLEVLPPDSVERRMKIMENLEEMLRQNREALGR
jgi:hypothetical protein